MAKCKHDHSVALQTTDIINQWEVDLVIENGNLSLLQQIEGTPRIATITTRFCPTCGRIYGEITGAA